MPLATISSGNLFSLQNFPARSVKSSEFNTVSQKFRSLLLDSHVHRVHGANARPRIPRGNLVVPLNKRYKLGSVDSSFKAICKPRISFRRTKALSRSPAPPRQAPAPRSPSFRTHDEHYQHRRDHHAHYHHDHYDHHYQG